MMSDGIGPAPTASRIVMTTTKPSIIQSTQWRNCYSNGFSFSFTAQDFSIGFLANINMNGVVCQVEEVQVQLTFSSLKLLSEHIQAAIKVYEEERGPIKVPVAGRPTAEQAESMRNMIRQNKMAE